jgi:hypothetical protein
MDRLGESPSRGAGGLNGDLMMKLSRSCGSCNMDSRASIAGSGSM